MRPRLHDWNLFPVDRSFKIKIMAGARRSCMRPAGIKDKETTDFSFSELHMCRNFPQGSEKGGGPPTLVHPVHFQRPLC